jgi:hypothetical protein
VVYEISGLGDEFPSLLHEEFMGEWRRERYIV